MKLETPDSLSHLSERSRRPEPEGQGLPERATKRAAVAQVRRWALAGAVLGMGSPLGMLAVRYGLGNVEHVASWLRAEWAGFMWIYLYAGLATVIVFSLFGAWAGRRNDALNAKAAALERLSNKLQRVSITDSLTGLFVHGFIVERLGEEIRRAARYEQPLGSIFIDVDLFKTLNDRYGHMFGDEVLTAIARVVREQVRSTDIAGRYGGDEIYVILPQSDSLSAYQVAERIRKKIEALAFQASGETIKVTVSLGVYAAADWPHTLEEFLSMSDRALRQAKQTGKNRTVMLTSKVHRLHHVSQN